MDRTEFSVGTRDLFKGTAGYYVHYRPGYPEEFFNHLALTFKLDGSGRLLDLGCGTGQLAIPLAPYFKEVVAMDPDLAMLREGRRAAKRAKARNVTWVRGSSETLGPRIGTFQLVVMVDRSTGWTRSERLRSFTKWNPSSEQPLNFVAPASANIKTQPRIVTPHRFACVKQRASARSAFKQTSSQSGAEEIPLKDGRYEAPCSGLTPKR